MTLAVLWDFWSCGFLTADGTVVVAGPVDGMDEVELLRSTLGFDDDDAVVAVVLEPVVELELEAVCLLGLACSCWSLLTRSLLAELFRLLLGWKRLRPSPRLRYLHGCLAGWWGACSLLLTGFEVVEDESAAVRVIALFGGTKEEGFTV